MDELTSLLNFHIEINKLKRTVRYESCPESVRDSSAEHSWHLALMVMDVANTLRLPVDIPYSTKLALVHDLCEYQGGFDVDSYFVATGQKTKAEKTEFERKAMENLRDNFGQTGVYALWRDYEEGRTDEGKYVRAMDKIEALVHLIDMGGSGRGGFDDADYVASYADIAVTNYPQVRPYLIKVKNKLKYLYNSLGKEWKPSYDRV